jgi:hypothetical protein
MKNLIQVIWDFLNTPIFKRKDKLMIKLIIDDPGLVITINGKDIRTPTELNIQLNKVNEVVTYLKSRGIHKYKFISEPDVHRKQVEIRHVPETIVGNVIEKQQIVKENIQQPIQPQINDDGIKELSKKLEKLEQILNKIADKEPTIVREIIQQSGEVIRKKKEDSHQEFIPSVDISNLQLKTSGSKTVKSSTDANDAADALSKLTKKED